MVMIATIVKSSLLGLALGAALACAAELPFANPSTATPAPLAVISTGEMTR
jgi:hypothetical protein